MSIWDDLDIGAMNVTLARFNENLQRCADSLVAIAQAAALGIRREAEEVWIVTAKPGEDHNVFASSEAARDYMETELMQALPSTIRGQQLHEVKAWDGSSCLLGRWRIVRRTVSL